MEFLCLNENLIDSLAGIEKFQNLKELQINFNSIQKIENIEKLMSLEKLWLTENKIKFVENLAPNINNLWLAFNLIEKLTPESFSNCKNLSEVNLSGNFLSSLSDIHILSELKNLRLLNLNDPHYGENPICMINNYRIFVFHKIPNLDILDEIHITQQEINENKTNINKKLTFYKNKIKQINRVAKSCFKMLKNFNFFYKTLKSFQIYFFRTRIKLLEYLKFERKLYKVNQDKILVNKSISYSNKINENGENSNKASNYLDKNLTKIAANTHGVKNPDEDFDIKFVSTETRDFNKENLVINNTSECNNNNNQKNLSSMKSNNNTKAENINVSGTFYETPSDEEFYDEINKEIDDMNNKINKALENTKTCDFNNKIIKDFISQINDFSIIRYSLFYNILCIKFFFRLLCF